MQILRDGPAVFPIDVNARDSPDAEFRRGLLDHRRIALRQIDLAQDHALVLPDQLVQLRRQRAARRSPVRGEIEDHDLARNFVIGASKAIARADRLDSIRTLRRRFAGRQGEKGYKNRRFHGIYTIPMRFRLRPSEAEDFP